MGDEKLDAGSKTGDLPGADFDDTKKSNDSISHLSSARIEQRFRKPLENPTAADGSNAEPVKARGEVDPCFSHALIALAENAAGTPAEPYAKTVIAEARRLNDENKSLVEQLEVEGVAKHLINKSLGREVSLRNQVHQLTQDVELYRGHCGWLAEQLTAMKAKIAPEATEQASPSEPVETRLAADGDSLATQIGRMVHAFDRGDSRKNDVRTMASIAAFIESDRASLQAEVRRLRELVEFRERENAIETEAKQKSWEAEAKLREERDLFRTASEAAELRIVELRTMATASEAAASKLSAKLARIERIVGAARIDPQSVASAPCAQLAEAILALIQSEREPKLPYNGY